MANPESYKNSELFAEMSREYKELQRRLDRNYFKWEEAQAALEKVEKHYEDQFAALTDG
jgi:ATP-binding cassette subfamily F protein 3